MTRTSQDLREDLNKAKNQLLKAYNRIDDRLIKLAKTHPQAVFSIVGSTKYKAQVIVDTWHIVKDHDAQSKLKYIENIENWIKEQNPTIQLKLNLFEEDEKNV